MGEFFVLILGPNKVATNAITGAQKFCRLFKP
jgi:hypothetical protein